MNSNMNEKFAQTINKSAQLLFKAFESIHQITSQFMKLAKPIQDKDAKLPTDNSTGKKPNYQHLNNVLYEPNQKKGKNNGANHEEKSNTYDKYLGYLDNYKPIIEKQEKKVILPDERPNVSNKEEPKKSIKKSSKIPSEQTTTKDKSKQVIPQKPKYPVSAYLRFNRENIEIVKKNYPHMSSSDLLTVTGNMWSQLSPELRKKFEDEYAKDKQRYDAALIEYHRKHPEQKKKKHSHKRHK